MAFDVPLLLSKPCMQSGGHTGREERSHALLEATDVVPLLLSRLYMQIEIISMHDAGYARYAL